MKNKLTYRLVICLFLILGASTAVIAQEFKLTIKVLDSVNNQALGLTRVVLESEKINKLSNEKGEFNCQLNSGEYTIVLFQFGYHKKSITCSLISDTSLIIHLSPLTKELTAFEFQDIFSPDFSLTRLKSVEGTAIYAGRKSEVILLDKTDANLATNNSRQIYAKVAGLNIWESDAAGLQLGIGGRGLSPNRTSNFNTRQNGYDISADALGYPESYYTPMSEAIDRIEIIRGAASLQYGTQFGGLVNFVTKKGNSDKAINVVARQAFGSFGLFNSFLSLSGGNKKVTYYSAFQYKFGEGWRPNSNFNQTNLLTNVEFAINAKMSLRLEYTYMTYLAKQAGGLTDEMFVADPSQSRRDRNWFNVNWNLIALNYDYQINDRRKMNCRVFGLLADRKNVGYLGAINRLDPNQERDIISGTFNNIGSEVRFMQHYNFLKKNQVWLLGARVYSGRTTNAQGLGTNGSDANFTFNNPTHLEGSDYLFPSFNLTFFTENIFNLSKQLSVTPGFRLEYISTSSDGYYRQLERDLAGNVILDQTIETQSQRKRIIPLAGLGISFKPSKSAEIYANFSQNYRAINFSDLQVVNPNFKVDPAISDEYGYTADMGWRGQFHSVLNYDISLFYINYKNRIGEILASDPSTLQIYRYRTNVGDSYNSGIESFVELNMFKLLNDSAKNALSLFANTTFTQAFYSRSEISAISNKRVEFVPQLTLRTGLSFKTKQLSISYQFSYCSKQFSDATNADYSPNALVGEIPAYWVMDISAAYTYKFLRIESGVNNLTNQIYFTRRASGFPGPGIIPAEPRNLYLALQLKF